jgi:hypothetical protein
MGYSNWFSSPQQTGDPRWLQRQPLNYTDNQSDALENSNDGTRMPTSTRSNQTLPPPHLDHGQFIYEQAFPAPYTSSGESSRTSFPDRLPQNHLQEPHIHTTTNIVQMAPEVNHPAHIQEGDLASHARLSGSVAVRGPYTSKDVRT